MAKKKTNDSQTDMFGGDDLSEGYRTSLIDYSAIDPLPLLGDYRLATNMSQLADVADAIADANRRGELVSFDTEFTGAGDDVNIHRPGVRVNGISIGVRAHDGPVSKRVCWYIPLLHRYAEEQVSSDQARSVLYPLMSQAILATHNGKIDVSALVYAGWDSLPIGFDTYTAAHFLQWQLEKDQALRWAEHTGKNPDHFFYLKGLKELALNELGREQAISYEQVITRSGQDPKKAHDFGLVSLSDAQAYVGQDADLTLELAERLKPMIDGSFMAPIYYRITLPLLEVLGKMERRGIFIDPDHYRNLIADYSTRIKSLDDTLQSYLGKAVGWSTDTQVRYLLYTHLALPVKERTRTGQPAVGKSSLAELLTHAKETWEPNKHCPITKKEDLVTVLRTLQERSKLNKLLTTYDMRKYGVKEVLISDKKYLQVHTQYNESGTATQRLSSKSPNGQNFPQQGEGKEIRNGVVAVKDDHTWYFVVSDLSQIEPRCMAYFIALLGDESFLNSYRNNLDIYITIATYALTLLYEQIDKEGKERKASKVLMLALSYGSSAAGLASNTHIEALGLDLKGVERVLKTLFETVPGIRLYHWNSVAWGLYRGYTQSLWGFPRPAGDLRADRTDWRLEAVRAMMNHVMQSFAAQVLAAAMVWLDNLLVKYRLEHVIQMVLQVHDEIDARVRGDYMLVAQALFSKCMKYVADLGAPMKIDIEVGVLDKDGSRWGNLVAFDKLELSEQAPETVELIAKIEQEPNPFADMPLAEMATPFDLALVPDQDLEIYLWHAAHLGITTLNDPRLPSVPNTGIVVGSREFTNTYDGKKSKRYRALLIRNGAVTPLHSTTARLTEHEGKAVVIDGAYNDKYATFDVSSLFPLSESYKIRESLKAGLPYRYGDKLLRLDRLRDAIRGLAKSPDTVVY
jgi:DNA polymerase I-like protein with 3'-5' exonuclease and polymerase domains